TTLFRSSHSENVLRQIRINGSANGATGIVQESFTSDGNNGQANQDGHIQGLWIANDGAVNGGRGLDFARAAGWTFRDVHMYGAGDDAARMYACYATDLDGWYIENYGNNDAQGDNYAGVQMELLSGRGCSLSNVKVTSNQVDQPNAGNLRNLIFRAGVWQTACVTIVGCLSGLYSTSAPTCKTTRACRFGGSGDSVRSQAGWMVECYSYP